MHHLDPLPRRDTPSEILERLDRADEPMPINAAGLTTFSYRGTVKRAAPKHFLSKLPPLPAMGQARGLWVVTTQLPPQVRLEYRIEVEDAAGSRLVTDPANPVRARDPFGANSVATASDYRPPWWAAGVAPSGRVVSTTFRSRVYRQSRNVRIYLPPRYPADAPYPIVYALDGSDLLAYADLGAVLDRLIDQEAVRPIVVALVDPSDRNVEYMVRPEHDELLGEVVRHVERHHRIASGASGRCLLGASLGGVAALRAAASRPDLWPSLILLSGSFVASIGGPWQRSPEFEPVVEFLANLDPDRDLAASRVFVGVGRYEALADDNRLLADRLGEGTCCYVETPDGHHWTNWRDLAAQALQWIFPGRNAD